MSIQPKGTKYTIQIELTRDVDVMESCIGRSLYSDNKQEIEGTFRIISLNVQPPEVIKAKLIEEITQIINKMSI